MLPSPFKATFNLGQVASEWWSWELIGRAYTFYSSFLERRKLKLDSAVAASLYVLTLQCQFRALTG